MHHIISSGRILNVPAVNNHRVFKLLSPGLVVHSQLVHVSVGHQHQLVHHACELVVIGYGDGGLGDLAKLGPVVGFIELHLEILVLLALHVVNDLDLQVSLSLAVFEVNLALASHIVLPADGRLVHRPPLDGDVAVRSVLSDDGDDGVAAALLHQVASLLELEGAGLVVIEDGDLHDASPAQLHLLARALASREQGELQEEFLVRLPLVVVHYRDADLLFGFHRLEGEDFIHGLVVLALVSRAINCLHPARTIQ